MVKIKNYINGNLFSESAEFIDIDDPSKGEKIGEVVLSNENVLFAASVNEGEVLWADDINSSYEFKADHKIVSMQLLNSNLYLFLSSGDLIVYDPGSGELIEVRENKIDASSIPPIIVNNNLYVISNDGELISYR